MNALLAQAQAAEVEDQTEVSEGGDFDFEPPAAGFTPARFIGYTEIGRRKQRPYLGKDKPDCDEVRVDFELNGPKQVRKMVIDGVEQTFTNRISIKLSKKLNDKAGFTKLFKKMLYGRDSIKHMSHMLGEGFLIQIVHNTVDKEGKKRTYANMKDKDGNFLIGAPVVIDPLTNESRAVPVPEPTQALKMLLWGSPTKEQWASLFIDGTKEVKDEKGVARTVSKNWLQEDIVQNAVNYEGSALHVMLSGLGDLTLGGGSAAPETPTTGASETSATGTPETPATPTAGAPAGAGNADDLMASLGLA